MHPFEALCKKPDKTQNEILLLTAICIFSVTSCASATPWEIYDWLLDRQKLAGVF